MKKLLREMGLGPVIDLLWHKQRAFWAKQRQYGPYYLYMMPKWRKEMEAAAWDLPSNAHLASGNREVYYMTGAKHWYQTAFCHYSLEQQVGEQICPVILDDGSLTSDQIALLKRLFATVRIISKPEVEERLEKTIPKQDYPRIHSWRTIQPLTRKLVDFHAGLSGWKLFLDSDMLFFKNPSVLLNWLDRPERGLYMIDCAEAYGYSRGLMRELSGVEALERINIGIFGLESQSVDWDEIEKWFEILESREGRFYNVTQCISAMLLSRAGSLSVDEHDYLVLPDRNEGAHPTVTLHHYVAESKRWYFRNGWRHVLNGRSAEEPKLVEG